MISADFAPNENRHTAWSAIKIMFRPWQYQRGKHTTRLRQRMKKYFPKHDWYFFISGRVALYKTLEALELKPHDEVIITAFTCEAVVIPILAHRLIPRYSDVDPQTYSMSPATIESLITKRTKALVLQHTFGISPHRSEIIALCHKQNIIVIEDLAHGWDIQTLAQSQYHTIKLLSFGRSKALSSIYGGAVATTGPLYQRQLKEIEKSLNMPSAFFILRALLYVPAATIAKWLYGFGLGRWTIGKLFHRMLLLIKVIPDELSTKEKQLIWDDRMSLGYPNALAGLLLKSLLLFDQNNNFRISICSIYNNTFLPEKPYTSPLSRYPILVDDPDEIAKKLGRKNIYVGRWYRKLQSNEPYQQPQAKHICERILNLPTLISPRDAQAVAEEVKRLAPESRS